MNRLKLVLSSLTAAVLSACTVQDEVLICHFPDENSDEYEVIGVAVGNLDEHFLEDGDLCYDIVTQTCYAPDEEGFEEGGEWCPS